MAETVRVDQATHTSLSELARQLGVPQTEVLSRAVERFRREVFFAQLTQSCAALRTDPVAWAEEQAESALWDSTSSDGLGDEGPYEGAEPARR